MCAHSQLKTKRPSKQIALRGLFVLGSLFFYSKKLIILFATLSYKGFSFYPELFANSLKSGLQFCR